MEQFLVMMLGVALILFGLTWIAVRAIGNMAHPSLVGIACCGESDTLARFSAERVSYRMIVRRLLVMLNIVLIAAALTAPSDLAATSDHFIVVQMYDEAIVMCHHDLIVSLA